MKRVVLLGVVLLALWAPGARADEAAGLPTDHPIHFPMVESLEPVAAAYWGQRGIALPTPVAVFLIASDPVEGGFGDDPGNRVWLPQQTVELRGWSGRLELCEIYLHERGHNAGLSHESGYQIMEPGGTPLYHRSPLRCVHWAAVGFKSALRR